MTSSVERQEQVAGEHWSGRVASALKALPLERGADAAGTTVRAALDLDPLALTDPSLSIDLWIEGTPDPAGLTGWRQLVRVDGWRGGQLDREGRPLAPMVWWGSSRLDFDDGRPLAQLRVGWRQSKAVEVGAELEVL